MPNTERGIISPDGTKLYKLVTDLKTMADTTDAAIAAAENNLTPDDTGWIETTMFTAATGWSIMSGWARRYGAWMSFYVRVRRTGTAITVPDNGDIPNTQVATLDTDWRPTREQVLTSGNTGRVASGFISSSGVISIAAVGGSGPISTGGDVSLGGMILL